MFRHLFSKNRWLIVVLAVCSLWLSLGIVTAQDQGANWQPTLGFSLYDAGG